jgi:predicted RND superfamily exporter protein
VSQTWHLKHYGNVSAATLYDAATNSATFYSRLATFRSTTTPEAYPSRSWGDLIGFVDGDLAFLVVGATMTMDGRSTNAVKDAVLPVVASLLADIAKPDSAATVFLAGFTWVWYATNKALLSGMLTGLAIAFPVAFFTLIFATQNVLIALYAILTIAMIVSSVLGAAALEGWGLGIAESIAAVIVVGFSVDYTIHLGHMYDHGGRHEGYARNVERARYAILKMGNTVLAGAVTTAGSGAFMFACQLSFFTKMAFLICCTIAFSLLYALCFFMPLLYLAGPSGSSGHVSNFLPKALRSNQAS